ncbi:hypothetical protein SODALDRAFT_327063 [Sodiomyces alkalinus F11]|uniref:Uncharacterized protein n=1 Tax=Sodiomyces alkalinus (strain CBS 110278 / VKM F-3762 / F11) TaxID=1314773 RepID=A0A3N2Q804_SODAK|nr:hypothetical protein SODALDRAFT_327063 [Sodiomyces alkalinus F11]ROT42903.1 hypothetical protein SODALDRAFT_327063 [Sodiomyces alkalinus F11]
MRSISTPAVLLFLGVPAVQAFDTPCIYQGYKCGFNLAVDYGYEIAELADAVALTSSIPNLSDRQLLQVLYRCVDINGGIAGNSFCFAGCIDMGGALFNDQCIM